MKKYTRKDDADIESAITFLVEKINEHNSNPKPLILNSLRVGLRLYEKGESKKVVIAGLLHDLQEDTNCTNKDIESKFGKELAEFIDIFDYDEDVHYKKRWTKAVARMTKWGSDAAILKLVDIHDNLHHLTFSIDGQEAVEGIVWRHDLVRDAFKELLHNDPDYQQYVKDLEEKKKEIIK